MSKHRLGPPPIVYLLLLLLLGGAAYFWLNRTPTPQITSPLDDSQETAPVLSLTGQISQGEHLLITADATPEKQAGIRAMVAGDFNTAIQELEKSRQAVRQDPETLIYLNNAQVAGETSLKIAVSVPIGSNLNVAQEILRGVAQAQQEINQSGGIGGAKLQVVIANDQNNPQIAEKIAREFVENREILAVVGHNSSNVSLAAAPIYQQGRLVMISPTSDAKALSGIGNYIFRTIPSVRFQADTLSRYSMQQARLTSLVICADESAVYSQSLKDEFTSAIFADGGRIANVNCDLAAPDFNANQMISEAIGAGADGLFLIPSIDRLRQAIAIARANQGKLTLLGSSAMYTFQTIQQGQADVNDLVLAVPWHPSAFANNSFSNNANQLWGGPVNWRTAMAYDAVLAIIAGLQQNPTRTGVQSNLTRPNFAAQGSTGTIEFLPSGDRNAPAILVKIQPGSLSGTGYDFVPIGN